MTADERAELDAFERARRRAGLDNGEPLTLNLFNRVIMAELWSIRRQWILAEQQPPTDDEAVSQADHEWRLAIIDRQRWAHYFATLSVEAGDRLYGDDD